MFYVIFLFSKIKHNKILHLLGFSDENAEKESTKKPEVFVKTENISELKRSEVLRERLKVMKEKRAIEEKLKYVVYHLFFFIDFIIIIYSS